MNLETILTDTDTYLFGQGTSYRSYEKMGAHKAEFNGKEGVHFAVWAPNAGGVSVIGDFNNWQKGKDWLYGLGQSGIHVGFIRGAKEFDKYKFAVHTKHGVFDKADPFAFFFENPPHQHAASIVYDLDKYKWNDAEWMAKRKEKQGLDKPISIYEVHLPSWMKKHDAFGNWSSLSYKELADKLVEYVKDMGFTHIETLPLGEYPYFGSWGYQQMGPFAATSRQGNPDELMCLIDKAHKEGIGVIVDWVPGHFANDNAGLSNFDGTQLFGHKDSRQGVHPDWGTKIYNYDRREVSSYLLSNAMFWADKYHVDGLRVDAVASMLYLDYGRKDGEWIPNKLGGNINLEAVGFLKRFNEIIHDKHPGILTAAEESTAYPMVSRPIYKGGLGFDLKWNMGWMNDTLEYIKKDTVHRKYHHNNLTFGIMYMDTENFVLPFSHDEVVHMKGSMLAKMPGDDWQKFANLRALYGHQFGFPGKKLNFMGNEIAQRSEWNHNNSIEWNLCQHESHKGIQKLISDLNRMYNREKALHEIDFSHDGFEWISCNDVDNSAVSYIRKARSGNPLVVVSNFTPVPRLNYRIGVNQPGRYRELLNTDAACYWGSNMGNREGVNAEARGMHGKAYSLSLTLPPLSTIFLKAE